MCNPVSIRKIKCQCATLCLVLTSFILGSRLRISCALYKGEIMCIAALRCYKTEKLPAVSRLKRGTIDEVITFGDEDRMFNVNDKNL